MTMHTSKSMGAIIAPHQSESTASLSSMAAAGGGGSIKAAAAINNSTFSHPTPRRSNQRPVRDGRQRPPTRKARNIQREYQILQSQTLLLLGTASASFLLFLLFTLPFAALIGLTVMVSSIGACFLVAFAAVKTRYQLELEHPLGLIRHLPESLRAHLTEKSLHDCLSPSGSTGSLPSLSHYNHSSKDSLSSLTQQQPLEQGNRQRHPRLVRAD